MVIKNKLLYGSLLVSGLFKTVVANAYELPMNTAHMQAMDKITGRVSVIDVPVNSEVRFGSFSIVVRSCKATPPEETPENYAFVDVADSNKDGKLYNIFKGWMTSSSPALNAVEHPIYDVWLLKCINKPGNAAGKMTELQLKERDELPKKDDREQKASLSKEAIRAAEAAAEAEEKEKLSAEDENASLNGAAAEIIPEIKEISEIPVPSAAIENNTEEQTFEDGSPVSLIPTAGEKIQTEGEPQQLINISTETNDVSSDVSADQEFPDADEKNSVSILTEEDILPMVNENETNQENRSVITELEISEEKD